MRTANRSSGTPKRAGKSRRERTLPLLEEEGKALGVYLRRGRSTEFDRFEELAPGMRPARCVDDSGSADMIVSPVTVTLEDALEVTQESFGPFSFATHSKVEDHRSGR